MEDIYESLLALQELDNQIAQAEERVQAFTPELESLDEPTQKLAGEVDALRARLGELQEKVRRLERGATEKRELLQRYEDRLQRARNAREVDAVQSEIDLVRGAAESDEIDALESMDLALRSELKLDEFEEKLSSARAELEPRRQELEAERDAAVDDLNILRDQRENRALRIDKAPLRLYERIRGGNGRIAITGLNDGACGACFGLVPIQQQSEIEQGTDLVLCEACGVILHPGSS